MLQYIRKVGGHCASLLLLLLLGADLAFIAIHIIGKTLAPSSSLCDTAGLYAYLTSYQLVKLFWAIILLAYVLRSTKCSGYVAWILVFTYLLFDEASLMHQKIGDYIAGRLDMYLPHNLGLQPRHFELAVLVVVGTFLMGIVAWAYFRSPRSFKETSKDLLLFFVAWAFFGMFTDMAAAVRRGPLVEFVSDIVEDGGEIVVLSLILWYAFVLAIRNGEIDLFLHDVLFKPQARRSQIQSEAVEPAVHSTGTGTRVRSGSSGNGMSGKE